MVNSKKKAKYLVFGGLVKSKTDGDIHYIPAHKVCKLYGLNPHAPNVRLASQDVPATYIRDDNSWIMLYPRLDGNYKLPE